MTKKHLSDLIKGQVNPNTQPDTPKIENTEVKLSKPSSSSRSRLTKAQLETQVKQLTDELATAQKAIEPLQVKINELETSIQEKNTQIKVLEADLGNQQKSEQKVNELEASIKEKNAQIKVLEADLSKKQGSETILQAKEDELREQKEKIETLTHQLQDYQDLSSQLAEKEQLIETLYRKLQDAEEIQEKPDLSSEKSTQLPVRKTYIRPISRYVAPTKSETLSNEDIGWFD